MRCSLGNVLAEPQGALMYSWKRHGSISSSIEYLACLMLLTANVLPNLYLLPTLAEPTTLTTTLTTSLTTTRSETSGDSSQGNNMQVDVLGFGCGQIDSRVECSVWAQLGYCHSLDPDTVSYLATACPISCHTPCSEATTPTETSSNHILELIEYPPILSAIDATDFNITIRWESPVNVGPLEVVSKLLPSTDGAQHREIDADDDYIGWDTPTMADVQHRNELSAVQIRPQPLLTPRGTSQIELNLKQNGDLLMAGPYVLSVMLRPSGGNFSNRLAMARQTLEAVNTLTVMITSYPTSSPSLEPITAPSTSPSLSPSRFLPTPPPSMVPSRFLPTPPPSMVPSYPMLSSSPTTSTPTQQPTDTCFPDDDSVKDWHDALGANCSTYERMLYCTRDGEEGRGWSLRFRHLTNRFTIVDLGIKSKSALDICCVCGGGLSRRRVPDTTIFSSNDDSSNSSIWISVGVAASILVILQMVLYMVCKRKKSAHLDDDSKKVFVAPNPNGGDADHWVIGDGQAGRHISAAGGRGVTRLGSINTSVGSGRYNAHGLNRLQTVESTFSAYDEPVIGPAQYIDKENRYASMSPKYLDVGTRY